MKEKWRSLVPNSITVIRIMLTLLFIFLIDKELTLNIRKQNITAAAIIFAIICLSDFIDGKIARYLGATSIIGAHLDVAADLFYILSSTFITVKFNIIPLWFLAVIILNFMQFIATSLIIKKYSLEKTKTFIFDYLGRLTAILLYTLSFSAVIINKYLDITGYNIICTLVYTITAMTILVFLQRLILCSYSNRSNTYHTI